MTRARQLAVRFASSLPWWMDRAVDWGIAAFAGWTVAYHLALLVDATRNGALAFGFGLTAVAIGLSPGTRDTAGASPESTEMESTEMESTRGVAARLGGVGVVAVLAATGSGVFWPAAFLLSIWLLSAVPRSSGWRDHRRDRPLAAVWVLLLAVAAGYVSAALIRWTSDDSYYVNRAQVIADSSGPMPYGVDTMHSVGLFPAAEPDNDLASWHPLAGVGADFAGTSGRWFISLVAQPLVAAIAVLAVWRAVGVLGTRRPAVITTLVFTLCFLLAGDGRSIWYHMWASNSGRTMLATAIVPLMVVYAVEAARHPGRGGAIRVAIGAIAGGGASTVAAFVLPPIIGAGFLAARPRPFGREMRAVWFGAIVGVAYAGVLAVIGLSSTRGLPSSGTAVQSVADQWTFGAVGVGATPLVIGAVTGLMLLAPVVASAAARRFAAFSFVLALAFVVSPIALVYGGKGGPTVFRGAWALVPMVLAAVAIDGLIRRVPGALAVAAVLLVAGGMGAPLTDFRLGRTPGPDLPVRAVTEPARSLIAAAPDGSAVAGPLPVLAVVPALTTGVYPLVAQERYGAAIQVLDPGFRHDERMSVVTALATGRFDGPPERLGELLDQFGIGAVALTREPGAGWVRDVLVELGFERRGRERGLTIWSR